MSLAPAIVLVPYVVYVLNDRFTSHNTRREELIAERKEMQARGETKSMSRRGFGSGSGLTGGGADSRDDSDKQ